MGTAMEGIQVRKGRKDNGVIVLYIDIVIVGILL